MKIYNKGKRIFNNNTEFAIRPGKWTEISDEMGQKLIKDHPREITSNSEAITFSDPKISAENDELKKKNAALEIRLKNLEQLVSGRSNLPDLVSSTRAPEPVETPVTTIKKPVVKKPVVKE